jgi:hypothetical protein
VLLSVYQVSQLVVLYQVLLVRLYRTVVVVVVVVSLHQSHQEEHHCRVRKICYRRLDLVEIGEAVEDNEVVVVETEEVEMEEVEMVVKDDGEIDVTRWDECNHIGHRQRASVIGRYLESGLYRGAVIAKRNLGTIYQLHVRPAAVCSFKTVNQMTVRTLVPAKKVHTILGIPLDIW